MVEVVIHRTQFYGRRSGPLRAGVVAFLLIPLVFGSVEATDKPSDREASAIWLRAYDSDEQHVKAQALGITTGIVATAKSFILSSECPKPKHVLMRTIADETANVIRTDMSISLVVATTTVWGKAVGCLEAVSRWIDRAQRR